MHFEKWTIHYALILLSQFCNTKYQEGAYDPHVNLKSTP